MLDPFAQAPDAIAIETLTSGLLVWNVSPKPYLEKAVALIRNLEKINLQRNTVHHAVDATFSIFDDANGARYLQIDTYGSDEINIKVKRVKLFSLIEKMQSFF